MIVAPAPLDAPIGVYIHVPFCAHICPYCDFTTYAGKDQLIPNYVDTVVNELQLRAGEANGRAASTIYLGGGTPSMLSPAQIEAILTGVHAVLPVHADAEITMEANPNALSFE